MDNQPNSHQIVAATELKLSSRAQVPKPGVQTSEFWLSLAAMLGGFLLASGVIPAESELAKALGALTTGLAAMGYSASRGKVKTQALPLMVCMLLAIPLLNGCVSVPANRIDIEGPTGTYVIKTPKNVLIENFKASFPTNGQLNIEFTKWVSTNDAQIIDKTALGQAEIIKQWGSIVTNAVAAGAAAALK